jgi:serine/threonine protein phosphatase PrpC
VGLLKTTGTLYYDLEGMALITSTFVVLAMKLMMRFLQIHTQKLTYMHFFSIKKNTRIYRVNGVLAVSRAMGDVAFKGEEANMVIATPETTAEFITAMTEFAIIASDGLWDVVSPQGAVNFVRKGLAKKTPLEELSHDLVKEALKKGSIDNVSSVIMSFHVDMASNELK